MEGAAFKSPTTPQPQQPRVQTKLTVACFKAESSPNTGAERGCCCPAELCPKLHFQTEYVKRSPYSPPPSSLQTALLLSTNHLTSFRFLLVVFFCCCCWWWVFFPKKRNSAGSLRPRRSRAPVCRRPGDEAFERFVSIIFFLSSFPSDSKGESVPRSRVRIFESVPSAVGVGSSCCLTQLHSEPTDSPPTNTPLSPPHGERSAHTHTHNLKKKKKCRRKALWELEFYVHLASGSLSGGFFFKNPLIVIYVIICYNNIRN